MLGADGAKERVAARSFGWRQPLAALVALTAAVGPLLLAAAWTAAGADGPLGRRDPVQVPAFVAAQSDDSNRTRTLVLGGDSPATVSYTLVRGSGVRLGDAELLAEAGLRTPPRQGRLQPRLRLRRRPVRTARRLRRPLRDDPARRLPPDAPDPRRHPRPAPAPPGRRHRHLGGPAAARPRRHRPRQAGPGPHRRRRRTRPGPRQDPGFYEEGRTLRVADRADPGWKATLDGKPLTPKTVDGWAQGFALPKNGGRLDLVHTDSLPRDAWHWVQGLLALVLLVMALPGRRARLDDDLPEEEAPAPAGSAAAGSGQGRRARRLAAPAAPEPEPAPAEAVVDPYAQIPAQQVYGEDSYAYQEPYAPQGHEQQQPYPGGYDGQYAQPSHPAAAQPYQQPYDPQQPHFPQQQQPHPYEYDQRYDTYGQHDPRPDGSPQQ